MEWSDCEKLRHEETDEETDYCKEQRIRLGVKFFSIFFSHHLPMKKKLELPTELLEMYLGD